MSIGLVILIAFVFIKGTESTLSINETENENLQQIKYGDKCVPGMKYKMDCNICYCGQQNNLLCTKAGCLHPMDPQEIKLQIEKRTKQEFSKTKGNKKKVKKIKLTVRNEKLMRSAMFPALPPNRTCLPGRIYQAGCRRCYCMTNRKHICSTEDACKRPKAPRDLQASDVRPQITEKEFQSLPSLPHSASPCTPGTTYKVDCNPCVCDESQNLLCDKLLCVSVPDMLRAKAKENSGQPCNSSDFSGKDLVQSNCVSCSCNGTTSCQVEEGCEEAEKIMRTRGSRDNWAYDYTKEKCEPDHIYTDNCNKCYCQKDSSLRCTLKSCLNYRQAMVLEEQFKLLREQGL